MLRHLAVIQHIAGSDGHVRVGGVDSGQIVLDCRPAQFQVECGIDETKLEQQEELGDDVPVVETPFVDVVPEGRQSD